MQTIDQLYQPDQLESIEQQRLAFVSDLVSQKLITPEFSESGVLDYFRLDATSGDALKHILVGNEQGGSHHVPTMFALDSEAVVESTLDQPNTIPAGRFRYNQRVRKNREFGVYDVVSHGKLKPGLTSMFPNEWSTQTVIEAIAESLALPGRPLDERGTIVHEKKVGGVKVRTITDLDGLVITSSPNFRKKR